MKSDSIIQDCHCFVNPFLGGICGFFGGRGAPASGGGFPSLSPAAPAFRLLFCPLSPCPRSQSDLPRWGRGRPRLFHARGCVPCIPGLNPRGTGSTCRCRRLNGGVPPALLARRALAVPGGGLPSLSPAAPAISLLFCPHPPSPFPAGRGRPRLFYARGFAPCIPGNRPGTALAMLAGNRFFGLCRGNTCFAAVKFASGQSIIEKSSWGFGGFFQEAPNVSPVSPVPPRCTQGETANCTKMRKTVDIERVYWYNGGGKGRVPCSAPAERDAGRVRKG